MSGLSETDQFDCTAAYGAEHDLTVNPQQLTLLTPTPDAVGMDLSNPDLGAEWPQIPQPEEFSDLHHQTALMFSGGEAANPLEFASTGFDGQSSCVPDTSAHEAVACVVPRQGYYDWNL